MDGHLGHCLRNDGIEFQDAKRPLSMMKLLIFIIYWLHFKCVGGKKVSVVILLIFPTFFVL